LYVPRGIRSHLQLVPGCRLYGESKIASVGSVSRIPATDIEDIVVTSISEHPIARGERPASGGANVGDCKLIIEQAARIDMYEDRLVIRLKSVDGEQASDAADENVFLVP
jgi:site-specific DNA recombinase